MRMQQLLMLSVASSMVIASGCTSMAAENKQAVASGDSVSLEEFRASQNRVSELETELAVRESDLTDTEARLASINTSSGSVSGDSSLFPPNPKAGQCYARVLIPAKYKSKNETVLTREASERFEVIPARYKTAKENVMVKEAAKKLEIVPAVYGNVQERVLVKPASKRIDGIPATYNTVTEKVLDQPAHTIWKKGSAGLQLGNVAPSRLADTKG